MRQPPVFQHDFTVSKKLSREIVRRWMADVAGPAVLHAILFHRVFGSVQPKEVEALGLTFPQVAEPEIESLVSKHTEQVVAALEHTTPSLLLSIRFLETRLGSHPDKEDSTALKSSTRSSSNKNRVDEDQAGLVWERWEIGFKIAPSPSPSPATNPGHHLLFNPIGFLSAQSANSSDQQLDAFRSMQHQLEQFLSRLIAFVLHERDHVPAITTSELLPFPVDISIQPCPTG